MIFLDIVITEEQTSSLTENNAMRSISFNYELYRNDKDIWLFLTRL